MPQPGQRGSHCRMNGSGGSRRCRECSEYLLTGRLANPRI